MATEDNGALGRLDADDCIMGMRYGDGEFNDPRPKPSEPVQLRRITAREYWQSCTELWGEDGPFC